VKKTDAATEKRVKDLASKKPRPTDRTIAERLGLGLATVKRILKAGENDGKTC
jgi:hypothetical protein